MSEQKSNDPEVPDLPQPETNEDVKGGAGGYIGETEKNLDLTLTDAKRANTTLLFNESDSLFKR